MFKNVKKFIIKVKNKVSSQKKTNNKVEKDILEKLPEKVESKFKLEEVVTFGFLFRTGLIILFLIYIGYIAANSLDIIYAIFTAFIISIALETTISFFSRYLYRGVSIIISYILLIFILTLGIVILIPFIISHISQIIEILSQKVAYLQGQVQSQSLVDVIKSLHLYPYIESKLLLYVQNPEIADKIREFIMVNISNILQTFGDYVKILSTYAISTLTNIFSTITQIIIVFTLAIFFSFEKDTVVYTLAQLTKTPKKTALKLKKLYYQLGEWLKGQILLGIFIGLAVYFGLWTLHFLGFQLENKGTLALIAGLMEFIPYLGPILGSLPALLVGTLSYGFTGFLVVGILFIIIQQIEGFIVPIIMNKALGVSPLMIVIMMLVGMKIMGIVGIILAIPFAVIISIMFEDELQKEK